MYKTFKPENNLILINVWEICTKIIRTKITPLNGIFPKIQIMIRSKMNSDIWQMTLSSPLDNLYVYTFALKNVFASRSLFATLLLQLIRSLLALSYFWPPSRYKMTRDEWFQRKLYLKITLKINYKMKP